jgi:hypothetical protein
MLKSKGPKREISLVMPHDYRMKQHRTSPASDGLDGTFGDAILMMGTGTGERDNLTVDFKIATKLSRIERNVIGAKLFQRDTNGRSKLLKDFLTTECFTGVRETWLRRKKN